ncbi:hypothetical protein G210_2930 [Candida maltosa Xu316]|uniref:TTI1 N-terminal TPR domain-containing protein n=1 Tax=Candida maltosa (strain Xu316) TaxID=1245528 RepID=M3JV71_CANMX|nr:hypothetical protein G210_2930 [Candida maltosa Xu316]
MESQVPNERLLSQSLFQDVKPFCIELSEISLQQPLNTNKVIPLLISIETTLANHHKQYSNDPKFPIYQLSPNMADYIFFPISNLLKHPSLDDRIVQHIFEIIAFLITYSWSFNVNFVLIDQFFPLLIFLSSGDMKQNPLIITTKSEQFKKATINAFTSIANTIDHSYFKEQTEKRLMLLSNTITITLNIITSTKPDSQESIHVILESINLISKLKNYLSHDQQSIILPGVVSSITKFVSINSSLNYQIIVQVLRLLSGFICASFNDKDLDAHINVEREVDSINDIQVSWDDDVKTLDDDVSVQDISITENDHRSLSWLKATSKQLKLSLMILFKSILFGQKNKQRLQSKPELYNAVVQFVGSVLRDCFVSLYKEFASLAIDVFSILIGIVSIDEQDMVDKISSLSKTFLEALDNSIDKETIIFDIVRNKLSDMIDNKFVSVIFSTDDDKVSMDITAIKFNFSLLVETSKKVKPNFTDVDGLKKRCLSLMQEYVVDGIKFESSNVSKSSSKSGLLETSQMSNQLDSIELPEFVNTQNIVKQNQPRSGQKSYIHNLQVLVRDWNMKNINNASGESLVGVGSTFLEVTLQNLIVFLSSLTSSEQETSYLNDLETILDSSTDNVYEKSVALWVGATYSQKHLTKNGNFNPNDFLNLEDGMDIDDDISQESSYLILSKAEELLDEVATGNGLHSRSRQLAYCSALQAIEVVAGTISLEEFRTNFLMDYLLTVFQALTYNDFPEIQHQAQSTIKVILDTYYNGSMVNLISDNSDYLIDNISLQLSVASNLTPMLPGILLIIVKVAGIQLLESNQLHDILTDMFVILDSYHGYNVLVESFFIVFEALIDQIKVKYDSVTKIEPDRKDSGKNNSLFRPWGMTNKQQLLNLLDQSQKEVKEFENYDSNKEYFKRKADLPFSEMNSDAEADSDDDDDDNESVNEIEEKEEPWTSPIPKQFYLFLQQIGRC